MTGVFAISGVGAIALVGLGTLVAVVVHTILTQAHERAVVRSTLRQLDGYQVGDVRSRELSNPLRQRAILPAIRGATNLARRFTPAGYVERVRRKFAYAGQTAPDAVDWFLTVRVLFIALVPVVVIVVFVVLGLGGLFGFAVAASASVVLVLGPDVVVDRRVEERQQELRAKLPDVLDLLTISVEAGLGFEQALDRTVAAVPGPLADEFARMLGEVRAGSSRADALRALDQRTNVFEIRSFVLAILQADIFGIPIGRVLRTQADEMRVKRRQLAQERAQKAPVKMLVPMVFCIFPALFVVVLGPAVLNIFDAFN
jgi:tight adherence protein C